MPFTAGKRRNPQKYINIRILKVVFPRFPSFLRFRKALERSKTYQNYSKSLPNDPNTPKRSNSPGTLLNFHTHPNAPEQLETIRILLGLKRGNGGSWGNMMTKWFPQNGFLAPAPCTQLLSSDKADKPVHAWVFLRDRCLDGNEYSFS